MTDELTWLRSLEQAVQKERGEFTIHSVEWARFNFVRTMIDARITALLEFNVNMGHLIRFSDSDLYNEICMNCGATDGPKLNRPCPQSERRRLVYCTTCHIEHEEGVCQ